MSRQKLVLITKSMRYASRTGMDPYNSLDAFGRAYAKKLRDLNRRIK